ncbi:hypothetical protein CI109_105055 [Kwoniella shandongensis]|uniref:ATPase inhibitor, mitochondrial n=1 Tax=Kwoniella shandongensis TaxID=1734106 RepID=A0A5M6C119_9TREE|nr:uncharacterized protein CI109_004345 [Kwoniella shandongensis]KAA5527285.1 hypothetical protein CI109_004345 [Kwoniella shandongensis]
MNVIRSTATAPARFAAVRAPVAMFARHYSPDSRSEGATASSTGFHEREQAKEAQYVRQREAEKLKAAQKKLDEAKAEFEKQQKVVDSHTK